MTIVITADEGRFIVEKALYENTEAETHINTVKEIRTSHPEDFIEITQEELEAYEKSWQESHPQPFITDPE